MHRAIFVTAHYVTEEKHKGKHGHKRIMMIHVVDDDSWGKVHKLAMRTAFTLLEKELDSDALQVLSVELVQIKQDAVERFLEAGGQV